MSVTLYHLSSGFHLFARRRWLYNTLHTSSSSTSDRERSDSSNRRDLREKLGDQLPHPKQGIVTAPSVVETSKIREHLDHIESTKHALVLEDVERYKPHEIPDSSQLAYDHKYREIRNALTQSFTKLQLRKFLKLYGLPPPPSSKIIKNAVAEILMKQWGLEPLAKVQEERADWRENSERLYPMSPAYAFLFMGKDGVDLLNLAKRYNVHLSFISNPLSLRIQGLKGAVKQLHGYLKNFEKDITLKTAQIPHGLTIPSQVTRSLSRLSSAHVEASDDGKLFITYRKSNPSSANLVERLAIQAASKLDIVESGVHFLDEPPSVAPTTINDPEPSYSFYPFFSPQISTSKFPSSSAFRLRRIGQWLRAGARYNMSGEDVCDVSFNTASVSEIKTRLLDALSNNRLPNSQIVVTATPGHILFLAPSGQTTFKPPIPGNVGQDVVLQWAKENPSQVNFNPSVPKDLITTWPHTQTQFWRIVYRALPVKSEIIQGHSSRKTIVLEILPNSVPNDLGFNASPIIRCQHSVETHVDILLPSRTTDIRISVSHIEPIASLNTLKELQSFTKELDQLTKAVDPPVMLTLDGISYILSSTSRIRQDHRVGSESPKGIGCDFVIETIINPEDGQQLLVCKVPCTNPLTDWEEFFSHCDRISMVDSKPSEHPLTMIKPWFQDSDVDSDAGTQHGHKED